MAARMSKVFKGRSKEFSSLSNGFDARILTSSHQLADYGVAGRIITSSYDQVQSLLAIATSKGIYVLGQNGVEVFYTIAAGQQVVHLLLHKAHLVAIDGRQTLYSWDLESSSVEPVITQALRGVVTCTYAEPSLDWLFLGMRDGTVLAWDLLGEQISAFFKIANQYFDRQEDWRLMGETYAVPRYHISPVISLLVHPTDLGMILITYSDGACLFSFKENKTKAFYECILAANGHQAESKPAVTCSSFSPDGRFVVIGCIDGTFAFYDAKDADTPLQVRNLEESDLSVPSSRATVQSRIRRDAIIDIKWCCRSDPTDTYLLIAGGLSDGLEGLSMLDYGKAPVKTTLLNEHFSTPQRQRIWPLTRDTVVSLSPLGTASPHHLAHDPKSLFIVNTAGVLFLTLPDGQIERTEVIPCRLSMICPRITSFALGSMSRALLAALHLNVKFTADQYPPLLVGGADRQSKILARAAKDILCTIHAGKILRMYDISRKQIDCPALLEVDLSLTMPESMVMSPSTGELAIASESGLVVLYRSKVAGAGRDDLSASLADLSIVEPMPSPFKEAQNMLFKFPPIQSGITEMQPYCVVSARKGAISALSISDIGFVAIGYDSGYLMLIDLRGPAIFFVGLCDQIEMKKKEGIFKKATTPKLSQPGLECATTISFLTLSLDQRQSLVALFGTNLGRTISFELLKEANGVYTAILSNIVEMPRSAPVKAIIACNQFGEELLTSGSHLSTLHNDSEVQDCLIIVSDREVVATSGLDDKISNTSFRTSDEVSSASLLALAEHDAVALVVAFESGAIEIFSIPGLQPLRALIFPTNLGLSHPLVSSDGDVLFRTQMETLTLFNIVGRGTIQSGNSTALMFDALKHSVIPRPTISNWAWVTGTQYVKASDLDLLISGGERPLSKRAREKLAAEEKQRVLIERQTASRDKVANRVIQQNLREAGGNERTTGQNSYGLMQAYGQERGERVSHVNDIYENMSKASGEWLSEIDKLASNAKKSAGKAALKSFLGF